MASLTTETLPPLAEAGTCVKHPVAGWLSTVRWAVGLLIAFLLLASAITHLGNPYQFLSSIYSYDLVPRLVAELLAATLPFLHIALAICLISGLAQRSVFGIGSLLFLLYTVVQTTTLFRGLEVDCGCFTNSEVSPIDVKSIGLAAVCALVSLIGWSSSARPGRVSATPPSSAAVGQ